MGTTSWTIDIDGKAYTRGRDQEIRPARSEASSDAEAYLGDTVTGRHHRPGVLQRRPAPGHQRRRRIAGLEVLRIINEPTAAALAYGLDKGEEQTIPVFDLGGGTFDVSVLEIGDGVVEVKSTSGDTTSAATTGTSASSRPGHRPQFKNAHGVDLTKDKMALQRLREAARRRRSSSSSSMRPDQPALHHRRRRRARHLDETLTARSSRAHVRPARPRKARSPSRSSGRRPRCQRHRPRRPRRRLDPHARGHRGRGRDDRRQEPNKGVNPDEVVAVGARHAGPACSGATSNVLLLDVTPLSLGIETRAAS